MMDLNTITGEQIKQSMIDNDITVVDHHTCALCGEMVHYHRQDEQLYFNSNCGCSVILAPIQPRHWDCPADWIKMQSSVNIKKEIAESFGITV